MSRIRVGVAGTGKMGFFHCMKLNQMKNVNFIGIFEPVIKRAEKISQMFQIKAFETYAELLKHIDAVIIAAPTPYHFSLSEEAIVHNKHVFVEKPMTMTVDEADKIKTLINNKNLKFQVGHIERFNPAIKRIHELIQPDEIVNIEAKRLAYSDRIKDTDVVLDVMIHDIDIILSLIKSPIKRISAEGIRMRDASKFDTVSAILLFENGIVANLLASNISHEKVRELIIYEKEKVIKTNYLMKQQQLIMNKMNDSNAILPSGAEELIANISLPYTDPLQEELLHFIDCIASDRTPVIGVEEGSAAVEVALKIKQCLLDSK
ncbi:Gfo/Idh/MocA family protein [Ureibacillus thermophilus]|uniref:Gfo/Idh/MocA family oxidoreductase n=1 Tax=Ureibacillus thermophilus TaxID=367743 RepID=A0A4P6UWM5_9BACL|nr:Gfo/Idh/MocA family oxidoreductase [Ureibacillus thermophilus]QBK26975.1 Gfo/Idh/MocA family oxidoreductase [Ureibacillus thermophilus]